MKDQKPSVGRIVHYTMLGRTTQELIACAAIVTQVVEGDCVSLTIFAPSTILHRDDVEYSEVAGTPEARGKWSWPARV